MSPGELMFLGFGAKKGSPAANTQPYRAYTTEFDKVATAASLLEPVRGAAESMLSQVRTPTPAQMKATLRALEFQARYRAGHDLGERPVFTLLVDHSGSMRGAKAMAAAILTDVVGGILDHEHILRDVLGFTTRSWKGGEPRNLWRSRGMPEAPGRLCELLHIVYADASQPHANWTRDIPLMMMPDLLKENVDGEALLWARDRAMKLNPTAWVCVLVSDGVPMDDATVRANGGDRTSWYLYKHLIETVSAFNTDPRIRLGCLSLDYQAAPGFRANRRVDALESAASMAFDLFDDLIWPTQATGAQCPT